jgi:isocitrate lyase
MTELRAPDSRWHGVERPYTPADVARLRGSVRIEYSLWTPACAACRAIKQYKPFKPG